MCKFSTLTFEEIQRENLLIKNEENLKGYLSIEYRNQKHVEWYLDKYPMARIEPVERIPLYVFLKENQIENIFQ